MLKVLAILWKDIFFVDKSTQTQFHYSLLTIVIVSWAREDKDLRLISVEGHVIFTRCQCKLDNGRPLQKPESRKLSVIPLIFLVENRPKNSFFWAKNAFLADFFLQIAPTMVYGGEGTPPSGRIPWLGFLKSSLSLSKMSELISSDQLPPVCPALLLSGPLPLILDQVQHNSALHLASLLLQHHLCPDLAAFSCMFVIV